MNEDVFIVAIVFGSIVSVVFLGIIGSIIKAWVRGGGKDSILSDADFMDALREFKQKTDHRLSDIETILADRNLADKSSQSKKQINKTVSLPDQDDKAAELPRGNSADNKLRNMLKNE